MSQVTTSDNAETRMWPESRPECRENAPKMKTISKTLPKPAGGFLVVLDYWEKQAEATRSLVQLQCLASRMGLRVVEPFVAQSSPFLGLNRNAFAGHSLLLSDLMNVNMWNKETEGFGLLPLAGWQDFLTNSTSAQDVIIVCMRYRNPPHVRTPAAGFDYRTGCPDECYRTFALLSKYGHFRVVRKACANFVDFAGAVGERSFIENVLYHQDYRKVTVILNEFRGFYGMYRTDILSSCGVDFHDSTPTLFPSQTIMKDAQKYVEEKFDNETFIAVLISMEQMIRFEHCISECALVLKSLLSNLTQAHRIKHRLFATDVVDGEHFDQSHGNGNVLLDAVYGESMSYKEWKSTFQRYNTPKVGGDSSYMSNLQRAIASKARCLVLMGGGEFVAQGQFFFERVHLNEGGRKCIHKVCYTKS